MEPDKNNKRYYKLLVPDGYTKFHVEHALTRIYELLDYVRKSNPLLEQMYTSEHHVLGELYDTNIRLKSG